MIKKTHMTNQLELLSKNEETTQNKISMATR